MTFYRRNLPHWHPPGKIIFITWRLYGSLPESLLKEIRARPSQNDGPGHGLHISGRQFVRVDRVLDRAQAGPVWLKNERIAQSVGDSLQKGVALQHYKLWAFVVMANHVHVLLEPAISLARITNSIKGTTARIANQLLGRTGTHFWQAESFDHWARNAASCERIRQYIENNPVKAGLVTRPEDWPWSSATK